MSHTAEIIAVGTEILLGNIANTDAQMLSQSLSTLGACGRLWTLPGTGPTSFSPQAAWVLPTTI